MAGVKAVCSLVSGSKGGEGRKEKGRKKRRKKEG